MSGGIPPDNPELRERVTEALRSHLEREPTSAEVDRAVKRWSRVDAINARNKAFWDEQSEPPSTPSPEALMRAEAMRMTIRAVLAETGRNRVTAPAEKRREMGDKTLKRVWKAAARYQGSTMHREKVAELVAPKVSLSVDHTRKLLQKLKIPK